MKAQFLAYLISGLLIVQLMACSDDERRIEKSVEAELKLHPLAHLVDLYKYFFQDIFGPGHWISDPEGTERYLDQELADAKTFELFDFQKLMFKEQFVRVNLRMIPDLVISKQELLNAFVMSAQEFKLPVVAEWRKEWTGIVKLIKEKHPDLPGFNRESFLIDSILLSGNYAVDHSQEYIRAYHPHYRLICRKYFDRLVLNENKTGADSGIVHHRYAPEEK